MLIDEYIFEMLLVAFVLHSKSEFIFKIFYRILNNAWHFYLNVDFSVYTLPWFLQNLFSSKLF